MINKIQKLLENINVDIKSNNTFSLQDKDTSTQIFARRHINGPMIALFFTKNGRNFVLKEAKTWDDIESCGIREIIPMTELHTLKQSIIKKLFVK